MKVMIVGGAGLLGQRLIEVIKRETDWRLSSVINHGIADQRGCNYFDTTNMRQWKELVLEERWRPEIIINAASIADPDRCEGAKEEAWRLNVRLVETLTALCRKVDAKLIQISSDQIFDGTAGPYAEQASPRPINYFGKTKHAAENVCIRSGAAYAIIRTSWLYGPRTPDVPDYHTRVQQALAQGTHYAAPTDETGTPVAADDLAYGIIRCIEERFEGILNISGPEHLSRYEYTRMIAKALKLPEDLVVPILSADFRTRAPRPLRGGLVTLKAQTHLHIQPARLEHGLQTTQIQRDRLERSYR